MTPTSRGRLRVLTATLLLGASGCGTVSSEGPSSSDGSASADSAPLADAASADAGPAGAATLDAAPADVSSPVDVAADAAADASSSMDAAPDGALDASSLVDLATDTAPPLPATCAALLAGNPSLPNGRYDLDLDGAGPSPARKYHCDMSNGGWTLVANQVPSAVLADVMTTINPENFGSLEQSYRLGGPEISSVRPLRAWKLTDDKNAVYFQPTCVVDWAKNYADVKAATDCTTGYTTDAFTSVVNGKWVYCSVRGIGINNSGQFCSIRMYEANHTTADPTPLPGANSAGVALTCDYGTAQRVSLWFR